VCRPLSMASPPFIYSKEQDNINKMASKLDKTRRGLRRIVEGLSDWFSPSGIPLSGYKRKGGASGVDAEGSGGGEGEPTKNYDSEDIQLKFRMRAGDPGIELDHEFDHIPTKEEIEGEYGAGIFSVYVSETLNERPKHRSRVTIAGDPTVPVVDFELKVRASKKGTLHDTGVFIPGSVVPMRDEIVDALGGGGMVKINARDTAKKVLWSRWVDITDVDPPDDIMRKENSFEARIKDVLDVQKKSVEDNAIQGLSGKQEGGSGFERSVDQLTKVIEDRKLEKLEAALGKFTHSLSTGGGVGDVGETSGGLTEVAFKEPYKMKLDAQKHIIQELAKTDPEKALKMLEKMPDGISVVLNLALAGTGLLEALGDAFSEDAVERKQKRRVGRGTSEEKPGGKTETKGEEKEKPPAEHLEEKVTRSTKLDVSEEETEDRFTMKFGVRDEEVK